MSEVERVVLTDRKQSKVQIEWASFSERIIAQG